MGGVMLGKLCRDMHETPYLLIEAHVAALEAESPTSNVTFTAASWTKIHEVIDRDSGCGNCRLVSYASGIRHLYIEEMDVFIQRHFFEAPQQVAIVIDPVARTHGGFAWHGGVPTAQKLLIEPGDSVGKPVDFRQSFKHRAKQRESRGAGRFAGWPIRSRSMPCGLSWCWPRWRPAFTQ